MNEVRTFEWDDAKRLINLEKHGIDFSEIGPAFEDNQALHFADLRKPYGEDRFVAIAACHNAILFIAYTLRGDRTRLISARLANQKERDLHAGH